MSRGRQDPRREMASGGGRGQDELDQQSMDYNRALFELSGQIR